MPATYYFSTHGCRFWVSLGTAALDEEELFAAARALLSKKLAIENWLDLGVLKLLVYESCP